jgi:hypothetical protein
MVCGFFVYKNIIYNYSKLPNIVYIFVSNYILTNILIMAVKPEQIKARLRILFPKANLSQKRIDAIAAKLCLKPADNADDTAIDEVLNGANDFMSFEDIAKDDDRVRTLEANQKTPQTPAEIEAARVEAERVKNLNNPKPADDAPEWAKALLKQNEKLTMDLEAIKTGNVTQTKKQTASDLFGKSEILKGLKPELKERWLNRVNVDSETSFDDQIKELESEYNQLVQVNADTNYYAPPAGGGSPSDVKADQAVVDKMLQGI